MLRGTSAGLEFVFAGRPFEEAWTEMSARLAERPDFYRGSSATAIFDEMAPSGADVELFLAGIADFGIVLRGLYGPETISPLAGAHELAYLGVPPRRSIASFERKRAARAERPAAAITESARSLEADFAGARADIAKRRALGEPSVPRPNFAAAQAAAAARPVAMAPPEEPEPATLYHRGTLRGGQTLQQLGTIVVVGDVNPGAELVATGDIVVFGALRGTAHAGAQGDAQARVIALELAPTQLRIATLIAADDGPTAAARSGRGAEVASIEQGRIAIAPLAEMRD
jgi:septum site-determining protein MinC